MGHATAAVLGKARQIIHLLRSNGVPAIAGLDTRALARHLRETGCQRALITAPGMIDADEAAAMDAKRRAESNYDVEELGLGFVKFADSLTLDAGSQLRKDTLNILDTGSAGSIGQLSLTTLTGLGMGAAVAYTGFEAVKIALGAGDDTFTLDPGTRLYTTIKPGRGNNIING